MTDLIINLIISYCYYLVTPLTWTFYTCISLLTLTMTGVLTMHGFNNAEYYLYFALLSLISSMTLWFRDIISEGTYLGNHTLAVQRGLNRGIYKLPKNGINIANTRIKNIGLKPMALTNMSKRSFSTTITLSTRYEELQRRQEQYLAYKREVYNEYINVTRRQGETYQEYLNSVSILNASDDDLSDTICQSMAYCNNIELETIANIKQNYINFCNQLDGTKYNPVQLAKIKREAYGRQLEDILSITNTASVRQYDNYDVRLGLTAQNEDVERDRQGVVNHVKEHYLRYKEMTRIKKEKIQALQRADYEYDSSLQGKSLPLPDSDSDTNSSVSLKKSELRIKYPWPTDGPGGPPGGPGGPSGGAGIGGSSVSSGQWISGGYGTGRWGPFFNSLENFIFNLSFDLLHIIQEHSTLLRCILPLFFIYKLYSLHIYGYIIYKWIVINDIYKELTVKKRTPICSWLTLQFYTSALQSMLNRSYNFLEWCLNSPPKPYNFVNLPLQSSLRTSLRRIGGSLSFFIAADGYRRTIINAKDSSLQTEATKELIASKQKYDTMATLVDQQLNNIDGDKAAKVAEIGSIKQKLEHYHHDVIRMKNIINSSQDTQALDANCKNMEKSITEAIKELGDLSEKFSSNNDITKNFNFDFLSQLSIQQQGAAVHIFLSLYILSCMLDVALVIYGDKLIIYLKLEDKYPRIGKYIQLRRKFQQYYLKFAFISVLVLVCFQIYVDFLAFIYL